LNAIKKFSSLDSYILRIVEYPTTTKQWLFQKLISNLFVFPNLEAFCCFVGILVLRKLMICKKCYSMEFFAVSPSTTKTTTTTTARTTTLSTTAYVNSTCVTAFCVKKWFITFFRFFGEWWKKQFQFLLLLCFIYIGRLLNR